MRCSLNEVERLCQKAAEGAGVPPGLDTDAARGAAWLVARDLPALSVLVGDLTRANDLSAACRFETESARQAKLVAADKAGAVIAPMLIDLLVARAALEGAPGGLRVASLTAPLFLLPPAVRYATDGWHFRLSLAANRGQIELRVGAGGQAVILGSTPDMAGLFEPGDAWALVAACARSPDVIQSADQPGLAVLRDGAGLAAAAAQSLCHGVSPETEAWGRLQALAAKVLVPASEQSRRTGAGATASDNE